MNICWQEMRQETGWEYESMDKNYTEKQTTELAMGENKNKFAGIKERRDTRKRIKDAEEDGHGGEIEYL